MGTPNGNLEPYKGFNTEWDQELIRTLSVRKRGHPDVAGTVLLAVRKRFGENEQEKEKEGQHTGSPLPSVNLSSPFLKLRQELMQKKKRMRSPSSNWTEEKFRRRIAILNDKNEKIKKMGEQPKRTRQDLPMVRRLTNVPFQAHLEIRKTYAVSLAEILKKHPLGKSPHFVEFSSLPTNALSDLSQVDGGDCVVVLLKSMKFHQWEKVVRYYGVFSRAGRIDRTVLYYLVLEANDKPLEQPAYKDMLKLLDPDPHEALFLLGKIIMTVYHGIVVQSESLTFKPAKPLSVTDIMTKIENGYKLPKSKVKKPRETVSV